MKRKKPNKYLARLIRLCHQDPLQHWTTSGHLSQKSSIFFSSSRLAGKPGWWHCTLCSTPWNSTSPTLGQTNMVAAEYGSSSSGNRSLQPGANAVCTPPSNLLAGPILYSCPCLFVEFYCVWTCRLSKLPCCHPACKELSQQPNVSWIHSRILSLEAPGQALIWCKLSALLQ